MMKLSINDIRFTIDLYRVFNGSSWLLLVMVQLYLCPSLSPCRLEPGLRFEERKASIDHQFVSKLHEVEDESDAIGMQDSRNAELCASRGWLTVGS